MMARKAVFMDIDGTLMEHGVVTERVIDAIQRARAEGHPFFICTGRSMGNIPQWLQEADYLDGFVVGCGMHCVLHGKVTHRKRIDREVILALAEYFLKNGRECLFEGEKRMLAVNSVRPNFENFETVDQIAAVLDDAPMTKVTIPGAYREDDDVFMSQWFTVYDMGGWQDAVPRGVTKATGMRRMIEKLGIPREECIGVGDGMNDLPMLEFAGLGVAMGNAPLAVKAMADAITESCADDGIATMIERYVLGEEPEGSAANLKSDYWYDAKSENFVVRATGGSVVIVDKHTRNVLMRHKGLGYVYTAGIKPDERECFALENGKHFYVYSLKNFELIKRVTLPRCYEAIDVYGSYSEDGKVLTIPLSIKSGAWVHALARYETENYSLIGVESVDRENFQRCRWVEI